MSTHTDTHLETWNAEQYSSASDEAWYAWIAEAQRLAGHDLDGDEATDGYSIDYAYDAWKAGKTPRDYILTIPGASIILPDERRELDAELRERLAIQADAENERDGYRG